MNHHIVFVPEAWEQYLYWQGQDKKTLKRINILIEAASREPFQGLGKPEPLKGNLSGYWSRRVSDSPPPCLSYNRSRAGDCGVSILGWGLMPAATLGGFNTLNNRTAPQYLFTLLLKLDLV